MGARGRSPTGSTASAGTARRPAPATCSTRRRARSPAGSRSPVAAELDAAIGGAARAAAEWGQTSLGRRVAVLFAFRELLEARKPELARIISAEHGKVVERRARRDRPGPGGGRVRVRDPAPAEGRLLRVGLDRHRRALRAPAARGGGRHHAVQLPGDGPDVDVPGGDRVRERLRAQAERAGSRRRRTGSPSSGPRRACRPGCSRWCTATRRRSTASSRIRTSAPSASSAPRRSRGTCTRRPPRTASGCRRSAARRTTWSCCPTPTSTPRPTPR